MPVIHAVAAHRHCHNLCPQSDLVQLKNGSTCRSAAMTARRSLSLVTPSARFSAEASGAHLEVVKKPSVSTTSPKSWLKTRSKSLFSGGAKSILNFNLFGTGVSYDDASDPGVSRRFYLKTKDKGIANKPTAVILDEDEMNEVFDVSSLKSQLELTLNKMKDEFANQLSIFGSTLISALELLEVEFRGDKFPLRELAQVGLKNEEWAILNLTAVPDACDSIMNAIQESGMQLNPQLEGKAIYIPLPKVTSECRETLAEKAKIIFANYKTSFQNVQNEFIKQCKSQKEASEDVIFSVSQQIIKMTEMYCADAEKIMLAKQKELLGRVS